MVPSTLPWKPTRNTEDSLQRGGGKNIKNLLAFPIGKYNETYLFHVVK